MVPDDMKTAEMLSCNAFVIPCHSVGDRTAAFKSYAEGTQRCTGTVLIHPEFLAFVKKKKKEWAPKIKRLNVL